jgi:hypothetical protein
MTTRTATTAYCKTTTATTSDNKEVSGKSGPRIGGKKNLKDSGHVSPLPEINQSVLASLTAEAMPYSARVREPVVPGPARYMVSVVIAIVTSAAARFTKVSTVPTG